MTFPNSKIMFNGRKERSNYYQVIREVNYFNSIISSITDEFLQRIFVFIETAPLSDYLKCLYKTVIFYRLLTILRKRDFVWEGVK